MKKKENKEKNSIKKEVKPKTIIISAGVAIIAFLILFGIAVYGLGSDNKFTRNVAEILPYPAVIVNYRNAATVSELEGDIDSVRKFYESQDFSQVGLRVDFSTEDGKNRLKIKEKEILGKLIEDKVAEELASKRGIKINDDFIDQNVERKLSEYGSTQAEIENKLLRLYGWKMDDFKNKIVKPSLVMDELAKSFDEKERIESEVTKAAKEKIEKANQDLEAKKDFAEVARTYSEGNSAQDGGEMGWFKKEQLIPDLADKVFSLEKGERTEVIESILGYHIVELEDRETENGQDLVKIRQIFTRQYDFSDWLSQQMKNFKIYIPLKDYYWNKDNSAVEFKNDKLKEFENNLQQNSQGDASMLF